MPEESYTYAYPRPILAADSAVFTLHDGALHILLVKRGHEPYEGRWAIPGGFVNENEPLDVAGARELREETGLAGFPMRQVQAFGDPGRDPRGWTVSIVFLALIDSRCHALRPGDDAQDAQWFPVGALPPLAFDHDRVVEYAVTRLRGDLERGGDDSTVMPATFGAAERQVLKAELERLAHGR